MALGLPIVASAIAPVREIVTRTANGLLVDPPTTRGFADAIDWLLGDRRAAAAISLSFTRCLPIVTHLIPSCRRLRQNIA